MAGFVDDAHAAATDDGFHVIARNVRQLGGRIQEHRGICGPGGPRSGKENFKFRLQAAHLPAALANFG